MPRHRTDADKLDELVELLAAVVRREGYAMPSANDTGARSIDRAVMLARSICFQWPDDDAPTKRLPPVRERILPPLSPAVRELKGAELLFALAEQLQADADEAGE